MTDFETEVRKLVPEDGDIIVIRTENKLSHEQASRLSFMVHRAIEKTGKQAVAILLEDGLGIELLKTSALSDRAAA